MPDRHLLLSRAKAMRREPTDAEAAMWRLLRSRRLGGLKFKRQLSLGPYIADFACLDPRVVVECDGGQHADSRYDAERDAWLQARGFRVLRFWNTDVLREPDGVAHAILCALGRA